MHSPNGSRVAEPAGTVDRVVSMEAPGVAARGLPVEEAGGWVRSTKAFPTAKVGPLSNSSPNSIARVVACRRKTLPRQGFALGQWRSAYLSAPAGTKATRDRRCRNVAAVRR